MAFNYNNEVIDLLLKKNLGTSYTSSTLVPGQESQVLEKFHNLQVFFDTITKKNQSAFTWSSATDLGGVSSVPQNIICLTTSTGVSIVSSGGNKYVFNNGSSYDSSKKYGLYSTTYTFTNVPSAHPIAILNSGNSNISYAPKNSSPIIIKVSGGGFSTNSNNDYYTFTDNNNNSIGIGNGNFSFMRGQSYKFIANGISSSHPFFIYYNGTSSSSISGNSGEISFTIPNNHSLTPGSLFYQCSSHSSMKKNLSLLNKAVSGTTNDGTYDFYYGDVTVTVTGDFGTVSVYCYYHGYMGGENLLKYTSVCQNSGSSLGMGTVRTLSNVAGETNPGYYTHIKKYENIPMTVVAGTEYRAWRPTNSEMQEKFKNVILGRPNFNFSITSNITSYTTIPNTSSAFKPVINNGVLIFLGNTVPQGNNTITMKEVYIVDGYSGTFANILLNDITDISSSAPLDKQPLIFVGSQQKWSESNLGFDYCPVQELDDLDDVSSSAASPGHGIFWNGFTWASDKLVTELNDFADIDTKEVEKITVNVSVPAALPANTTCLTTTTRVNIISSGGNKYVFNNGYSYNSVTKYGLYSTTYTFTNVPSAHPIAILNSGNSNISYSPKNSSPIIIKVSGGGFSTNSNNDYYTFTDSNNNTIGIGNSNFSFMRGQSYKFVANGISSSHPFFIYHNGSSSSSISGNSGEISFTIPNNHSLTQGSLFYQCSSHSSMKKNMSLLNKVVSGTTNDGTYDFYYGDVTVTVTGDFGTVSVYCYYHGYMGGENLLTYVTACNPSNATIQQQQQNVAVYNDTKFPLSLMYSDVSGNFRATRVQYPVTTINDISNVDMSGVVPENNQILVWDETFGQWMADDVSEIINSLNDISGVNINNIKFDEGLVLDPSGGNKFTIRPIPRRIDFINDLRDVNITGLSTQIPQWTQIVKMQASDENILDNYGNQVAMNDEYLLIGSLNANGVSLSDVGKVYVWKKSYSTYSEFEILAPEVQSASMNFGSSLAIKDNFIMIGAPNMDVTTGGFKEKAGKIYYYKYNGATGRWGISNNGFYKEDEVIEHGSAASFDRFGCSISIDTYMIVGASGKGGGVKGKACVYKYQSNNWVFVKDIVGSTSANGDEFGHKVETRGNQAFVSAPNHNTNRGIIYIYNRTTGGSENWGEVQRVENQSGYIDSYFGWDFCFGSEWGVIGSKTPSNIQGEAFFIKYYSSNNRWGYQGTPNYIPNQKVVASDGNNDDGFGYAVSLYGNDAIIGAYKKEVGGNDSGGAYLYKNTGENFWELNRTVNSNDLMQGDEYGISVYMYNRYALVGSWKEDSGASDLDAGAAYLFNLPQPVNSGTRCLIYDTDVNRYVVGLITSAGVGTLIRNVNQLRDISGAEWENTTDICNNSVIVYDDTLLPVTLRYKVIKPGSILKISDISGVDLSGVETGNALIYDASLNKWVPGEAGGGAAAGVGVFNTPPETDPPTIGQMYYDSSDNKFYGRLIDTWEEVLTHGTGYFFGHPTDTISHFNNTFSMKTEDWTTSSIKIREFAATIQFLNTDGYFWAESYFNGEYRVVVSGALTTLYNSTYGTTGAQLPGSYDYTSVSSGIYFYATWKPPPQDVLDNICDLVNTRMFSINWRNPIQRKSPIAPKNASDKVDGDYYLPVIHDMYIEIVPENQNYTGTGIKIGGKNLNTNIVDGNTTQKVTVPPTTPNELGGPYSSPATILTNGVRIYKTGESPDGFTGTKDNIQKPGGYGENQIYRINPSTLTLASGTTYKARVWFLNSTSNGLNPETVSDASALATRMGYKLGGGGYPFSGSSYITKGLYGYKEDHTSYPNMAFFGIGGTSAQMQVDLDPSSAKHRITLNKYKEIRGISL